MKKIVLVLFLLSFTLAGCFATVQRMDVSVYPDPKADMGLVYFYREARFAGGAISYFIYDGENKIGALASGTYFFYWAEPGDHTFWAKTEQKSSRTINIESGKTYYINGDVRRGSFVASPRLLIINEMEGKSRIKECKYAVIKGK